MKLLKAILLDEEDTAGVDPSQLAGESFASSSPPPLLQPARIAVGRVS